MIGWKLIYEEKRRIREAQRHCKDEQKRHLRRQYNLDRKQEPRHRPGSACLPAFEITRFPFVLGRLGSHGHVNMACNYAIADMPPYMISREHCSIVIEGGELLVQDENSYLGTILNDKKLGRLGNLDEDFLIEGDNHLILGPADSPYKFILTLAAPLHLTMRPDF